MDVTIVNDEPVEDISGIGAALTGPVLFNGGRDLSATVAQRSSALLGNEVTWDPENDAIAFSLVGRDQDGTVVFVTVAAAPGQDEARFADIVAVVRELRLEDAMLLGTSADPQQSVAGLTPIVASPRKGSHTGTGGADVRKLSSIILAEPAGTENISGAQMAPRTDASAAMPPAAAAAEQQVTNGKPTH